MTAPQPSHSERVQSLLVEVESDRDTMLKRAVELFGRPGGPMYPLDFMAFGAVKRNISTAGAFHMLVKSWNMVCARSLLRIHIDTSLRFSAAWLVDDPHDFAMQVLRGDRIDRIKDKDGRPLSDARLIELRSPEYPWLSDVYKNLSGYVHFSGSHIVDSVENLSGDNNTISFEISDADLRFPESSWIEILQCFREATEMLGRYIEGYSLTKRLSPEELEAARRQQTFPSSGQSPTRQ